MLNPLLLLLLPFASSLILMAFQNGELKNVKTLSFILSLIPLGLLLYGWTSWEGTFFTAPFFNPLSIHLKLGVDALSLLFLFLTAIVVPYAIAAAKEVSPAYYILTFLLEGLLIGLFMAKDLALFTFFWEASLIPLYFILALFGGSKRNEAATTFILYMIAGSTLMIAAILSLYFATGTFDISELTKQAATSPYAHLICFIFLLAFAVKTPLFPFHAWLPEAYFQAPTGGSILFAGLLSKAGIYGLFRISAAFFPDIMKEWSFPLIFLSVAGVLYGAFAAWGQSDYKKLIAYSSFSHVNFILVGFFTFSSIAHEGALLQTFNHGILITALFLLAGWLSVRIQTTSLSSYQGLSRFFPKLCWITFTFVMASAALPGTNQFVGEIIILYDLFLKSPWMAALLATSVVLSIVYLLKWIQSVYFGKPSPLTSHFDLSSKEVLLVAPLLLFVFWIGIYPSFFLETLKPAIQAIFGTIEVLK